jgi:transposase
MCSVGNASGSGNTENPVGRRLRRWRPDGGYKLRFAEWVAAELGWRVEAVQHPTAGVRVVWVAPGQEPPALPSGFRVLKRRWMVERTIAWLGRNRRLSKDYEALPASEEAWIYAASVRLLLRRLAR